MKKNIKSLLGRLFIISFASGVIFITHTFGQTEFVDFPTSIKIPKSEEKASTSLNDAAVRAVSQEKTNSKRTVTKINFVQVQKLKSYSAKDLINLASLTAKKYDIPENLFYSLIMQESRWKINATSYKGAKGLTQLMPGTAQRFGLTVNRAFDERVVPEKNLDAGARYFKFLLNTFQNNYSLALAAYNAGEGAVFKYKYQIPPYTETRNYVAIICNSAFGSIEPCLKGNVFYGNKTAGLSQPQKMKAQNLDIETNNPPQEIKPLRINTSVFRSSEMIKVIAENTFNR